MAGRASLALYARSPVWAQDLLCTLEGARLQRLRYGGEFERWAAFHAGARRWSEAELLEYQREQVRGLLRECFETVPFYAERWRAAGLSPDSFRGLEDLARFPATTKDDVFEAGGRMVSTAADRRRLVHLSTGGTTGTPLDLVRTAEEIQRHYAVIWDRMRPGVSRQDYYAAFQGKEVVPERQSRPPYWRENRAGHQRLYSMRHLAPAKLDAYARSLVETPFVYYQGYANFMALIAEYMESHGLAPRTPPRAVFSTSDQLGSEARALMERAWRTRVWDDYGQAELASLIQECEHRGRHVQMDYGVVELESRGHEEGLLVAELVCTGFIPRAMPLVRYRVGDLVLVEEGATCPCGRPGPLIRTIRGRTSEFIVTPDGRRYPTITHFANELRHVRRVQVVQERPDAITVRVVVTPEFDVRDEALVARRFRERIGPGLEIRVERVDELERLPNGKVLNIINRLPGERGSRLTAAGRD